MVLLRRRPRVQSLKPTLLIWCAIFEVYNTGLMVHGGGIQEMLLLFDKKEGVCKRKKKHPTRRRWSDPKEYFLILTLFEFEITSRHDWKSHETRLGKSSIYSEERPPLATFFLATVKMSLKVKYYCAPIAQNLKPVIIKNHQNRTQNKIKDWKKQYQGNQSSWQG